MGSTTSLLLGITDLLFSRSRLPWVCADFLLIIFMFHLGLWASPFEAIDVWNHPHLLSSVIFSTVFCFMAVGTGYYDRERRFDKSNTFINGFILTVFAALAVIGIHYFVYFSVLGRTSLVLGSIFSYLATVLIRLPLRLVMDSFPYRFTVFGKSDVLTKIEQKIKSDERLSKLYNYVSWNSLYPEGQLDGINPLTQNKICDIVVAQKSITDPQFIDFALHAVHAGCRVIDEITFYGQVFDQVPIDHISKPWLLSEGLNQNRRVFNDLIKRTFDVMAALLGIILASPLMLTIAFIIRLTSKGPVIFTQYRAGRFFVPFKMYKFRTMVLPQKGTDHLQIGFTEKKDPRVTYLGRIIRPLHFDELPQLFNILFGHMSLVGPRPEALHFAERMKKTLPLYELRYLLRPGLTGHAQLGQGYAMDTIEDTTKKLSYDLYYLCDHTIAGDLHLILRTIWMILNQLVGFKVKRPISQEAFSH